MNNDRYYTTNIHWPDQPPIRPSNNDYIVTYDGCGVYGILCLIVRAPDTETAIQKAKQTYPVDEKYPPDITVKLLDDVLAKSDDIIELANYFE